MKIITLSKEEFDNFSTKHKYNTYYQSSSYAEFAKNNEQYNVHYLGFINDDNRIIGASLMLYKTLFWGYKYAYSPRGFLIDYDDIEMINVVTKSIKKLLKKQKFIFVKIDPLIVVSERDQNGKIIQFNNNVNNILDTLKKNGYEHLGFNIYNETSLPRWNVIAKLNKDGRILYNNFSNNVKEKISYSNNLGLVVVEDNDVNIDYFYDFIKKSYGKISKKRFQLFRDSFINNKKIKIFYAKLDTRRYVENANKLYSQEEEKNLALANIIQSGDSVKYNIPKAIQDKLSSDKLLHNFKKDIVASTKLMKSFPDGIVCGAALTLEDSKGVNIYINYVDNDYVRYYPDTMLIYEIMKIYGKLDYKYINIGPVTGNFDSSSKYYQMLENKLGFNSSILEYIGEFNLIINPTLYRIYKKKYNNQEKEIKK